LLFLGYACGAQWLRAQPRSGLAKRLSPDNADRPLESQRMDLRSEEMRVVPRVLAKNKDRDALDRDRVVRAMFLMLQRCCSALASQCARPQECARLFPAETSVAPPPAPNRPKRPARW